MLGRLLPVLVLAASSAHAADAPLRRVRATGNWSFAIPRDFQLVVNPDSVQAHKGSRLVYISSLEVKEPGGRKTPAAASCASLAARLGKAGERLSFAFKKLRGEAEISRLGDHWQLKGVVCAEGSVATCLIEYPDQGQRAWAVATWKSVDHP